MENGLIESNRDLSNLSLNINKSQSLSKYAHISYFKLRENKNLFRSNQNFENKESNLTNNKISSESNLNSKKKSNIVNLKFKPNFKYSSKPKKECGRSKKSKNNNKVNLNFEIIPKVTNVIFSNIKQFKSYVNEKISKNDKNNINLNENLMKNTYKNNNSSINAFKTIQSKSNISVSKSKTNSKLGIYKSKKFDHYLETKTISSNLKLNNYNSINKEEKENQLITINTKSEYLKSIDTSCINENKYKNNKNNNHNNGMLNINEFCKESNKSKLKKSKFRNTVKDEKIMNSNSKIDNNINASTIQQIIEARFKEKFQSLIISKISNFTISSSYINQNTNNTLSCFNFKRKSNKIKKLKEELNSTKDLNQTISKSLNKSTIQYFYEYHNIPVFISKDKKVSMNDTINNNKKFKLSNYLKTDFSTNINLNQNINEKNNIVKSKSKSKTILIKNINSYKDNQENNKQKYKNKSHIKNKSKELYLNNHGSRSIKEFENSNSKITKNKYAEEVIKNSKLMSYNKISKNLKKINHLSLEKSLKFLSKSNYKIKRNLTNTQNLLEHSNYRNQINRNIYNINQIDCINHSIEIHNKLSKKSKAKDRPKIINQKQKSLKFFTNKKNDFNFKHQEKSLNADEKFTCKLKNEKENEKINSMIANQTINNYNNCNYTLSNENTITTNEDIKIKFDSIINKLSKLFNNVSSSLTNRSKN